METFHKFLSEFCVSLTIHVSCPNLTKIGRCKVAEKSSRIADKKKPGVGDTFEHPISPPLNRSRPKFRERCRPLTCACKPTLVRIGCGLPELFRKESKKLIQYRLSAYNNVISIHLTVMAQAASRQSDCG